MTDIPKKRIALCAPGIRIVYENPSQRRAYGGKLCTFGSRRHGWKMLAIRVGKLNEPENRAVGSFVVGLHFRDGHLSIELLNPDSTTYCRPVVDLASGPAYDRITNDYIARRSGSAAIQRTALQGSVYRLSFQSGLNGDFLMLSPLIPPRRRGGRGGDGEPIVVNLSAIFAIGPLQVRSEGVISYDGTVVCASPVESGELFPFIRFPNHSCAADRTFMSRCFETLASNRLTVANLRNCEATYNHDHGGTVEAAVERFRDLLKELR